MVLIHIDGITTLTDTNETNLFSPQTPSRHYATQVFLDQMVIDDVLILRVYIFDNNASLERLYDSQEFKGPQGIEGIYIPFIPVEGGYRVSAQRSSSSNITITWNRSEAT